MASKYAKERGGGCHLIIFRGGGEESIKIDKAFGTI